MTMRMATMFIIKHIYRDDDAIRTVLNYAIDSRFAIDNKIIYNNLRVDSFEHMVEDFKSTQQPYAYLMHHRKLFHFVLTTTNHKTKERTLDEGAYALATYFEQKGHQFLMVPHYASVSNPEHYHWHVVVNVKSYITGLTMLDKYSTYSAIIQYLNQNPYTKWSYRYRNDTNPQFLRDM